MLALVILFFLTITMIPLTYNMKQQVLLKQKEAHAAEVAFNAALKYKRYGEIDGHQEIDGAYYAWAYRDGAICVTYEFNGVDKDLCV